MLDFDVKFTLHCTALHTLYNTHCTPCSIHTADLVQYTWHTCTIHTACLSQYTLDTLYSYFLLLGCLNSIPNQIPRVGCRAMLIIKIIQKVSIYSNPHILVDLYFFSNNILLSKLGNKSGNNTNCYKITRTIL